jgi:hypothetical protein
MRGEVVMNLSRREQLAYVLGLVEVSTKFGHGVKVAAKFAKENGIERNMHIGRDDFIGVDTDNRMPEYLMGQLVDMYEDNEYGALNIFRNLSRSHLEGVYGYE